MFLPLPTQLLTNQPFDETLDINDSEEVASLYTPTPRQAVFRNRSRQQQHNMANNSSDEYEEDTKQKKKEPSASPRGASENNEEEEEEDDDDDDSDETESDEEEGEPGSAPEGAYDPADYDHLRVTAEIKELFQYITRYTPQTIELDHKLKPFIPDFIPAVGDIDAFLKVPRPDGKADGLGLLVLDEPCAKQSDPTVLSLWLSENSKQHNVAEVKVKSIENPQRNPKAIDNWIESISELHRSKPPATVHYTRQAQTLPHCALQSGRHHKLQPMPDIDTLMQEWPPEFEELLGKVNLPTADINCDLAEYIDIICGILDIPVYKNRIQSLHVLFTLYSEFKNSQHFKALAEGHKSNTSSAPCTTTAEAETLTLESVGCDLPLQPLSLPTEDSCKLRITYTMPGGHFVILLLLLWQFAEHGYLMMILVVAPPTALRIAVSGSRCPLTLRCEVTGEVLNLRWLRDGQPLTADNRISFNESNRTMQVSCLNISDWGRYTCQASNANISSEAHVNITGEITIQGEQNSHIVQILYFAGGTLTAILILCIILMCICKHGCCRTDPSKRKRGRRRTDGISMEEPVYDEPMFCQDEPVTPVVDLLPYVYSDFIKPKTQPANKEQSSEDFGYSTIEEVRTNAQAL
ncbi:hypothetical protein NFI96_024440 [Prochilodus magdalenae]|nr:hypothetical protein NFI96_024440 [Prochilodus magdalenae]